MVLRKPALIERRLLGACLFLRNVRANPRQEQEVVTISKAVAERVAKAFHVILNGLEPLGILFKKSQRSYRSGHFRRANDKIILHIDETLIDRFGKEQKVNSWQWREGSAPSGRLNFLFKTDFYGKPDDEKQWTETPKIPPEKLLPQIIAGMRLSFLDCQKRRIQEEITRKQQHEEWKRRQREREAEEEIRIEKERKLNHENAIKSVVATRKLDLIKGAEWCRVWKNATEFIDECERRWTSSGCGLDTDQTTWLAWARDVAKTLSPFDAGYPEPTKHGEFDSAAITLGGPYPSTQNFPQPPTMRSS